MTSDMTTGYSRDDADPTLARVVYILYLVSLAVGITALAGLIIAWFYRRDAPPWLYAHYRFQIRTFWIGLLWFTLATLLLVVGVGFLLYGLVYAWIIVRCIRGWRELERRRAPEPLLNWWW
ncbi:putative membrane protein [Kushneria sinocarnis]|uniref:Putative membrane protein n=1 Tax=Kushneria sinocarnis TaxID=595502 RepID=A0A420WX32_9GAMM|nr:hypothetical protein [Kushneria sinocarnis]RKR04285.1 putative membrane protein [Kushneria sinocarnis]